jgi:hypothetical protein
MRHVWIKAPFHKVLRKRCLHHDIEMWQLLGGLEHSDDDGIEDEDARVEIKDNEDNRMEGNDETDLENEDVSG